MNEKYLNYSTDMADERVDTYKKVHNLSQIDGVEVQSETKEGVVVTTVNVLNENGVKAVSKEIGTYITMEIQDLEYLEEDKKKFVMDEVAKEVTKLIGSDKNESILVVGLGNVYVTPDALGPKVIQKIEVTRHLINFAKELVDVNNTRNVSAISPGVLGTTGIETSEIVNSVVSNIKPSLVIVIDSLASQSIHRIGKTIQLSNTGITPGAGVKNKREAINKEALGVKVIAIGVPTVVDMATITNEAIDKMIDTAKKDITQFNNYNIPKENILKVFETFENDTRYDMIANVLDTQNYMVTPKNIDNIIESVSHIISSGMNIALQSQENLN